MMIWGSQRVIGRIVTLADEEAEIEAGENRFLVDAPGGVRSGDWLEVKGGCFYLNEDDIISIG